MKVLEKISVMTIHFELYKKAQKLAFTAAVPENIKM